jgi:hypothetical protein
VSLVCVCLSLSSPFVWRTPFLSFFHTMPVCVTFFPSWLLDSIDMASHFWPLQIRVHGTPDLGPNAVIERSKRFQSYFADMWTFVSPNSMQNTMQNALAVRTQHLVQGRAPWTKWVDPYVGVEKQVSYFVMKKCITHSWHHGDFAMSSCHKMSQQSTWHFFVISRPPLRSSPGPTPTTVTVRVSASDYTPTI